MNQDLSVYRGRINLLLVVVGVLSLIFIVLHFIGYGSLVLTGDDTTVFTINGHRVQAQELRVRPATYEVSAVSPRNKSVHQAVTVHLFGRTVFSPKLSERNADDIAGAALGSYGLYGPPVFGEKQWFNNDTWLAGTIGPGSAAYIALHYDAGQWKVAYFTSSGYPKNLNALPQNVSAYVQAQQKGGLQ